LASESGFGGLLQHYRLELVDGRYKDLILMAIVDRSVAMVAIRPRCKASRPWLLRHGSSAASVKNGTRVTAHLPNSACSILATAKQQFYKWPTRRIGGSLCATLKIPARLRCAWLARFKDETRPHCDGNAGRSKLVNEGLDAVFARKKRETPPVQPIFDKVVERKIVATAHFNTVV
jgi:hypothetical protein